MEPSRSREASTTQIDMWHGWLKTSWHLGLTERVLSKSVHIQEFMPELQMKKWRSQRTGSGISLVMQSNEEN